MPVFVEEKGLDRMYGWWDLAFDKSIPRPTLNTAWEGESSFSYRGSVVSFQAICWDSVDKKMLAYFNVLPVEGQQLRTEAYFDEQARRESENRQSYEERTADDVRDLVRQGFDEGVLDDGDLLTSPPLVLKKSQVVPNLDLALGEVMVTGGECADKLYELRITMPKKEGDDIVLMFRII